MFNSTFDLSMNKNFFWFYIFIQNIPKKIKTFFLFLSCNEKNSHYFGTHSDNDNKKNISII